MKNISALILDEPEEHEIYMMPDVRLIGIARRCAFQDDMEGRSPHEEYWKEFISLDDVIRHLPLVIKDALLCWTGDTPAGSDSYTYMPCVMCSAGTPVPHGLDYRDLPASYVAKGLFGDQTNISDVVMNFRNLGFTTCYTDLGWNAKLFLSEEEKRNHYNTPCRWLVPCIKVDEA